MALPLVGAFDDGRLGLEVRSRSSMATPAADAGLVPPAPHIVAGAFRAGQFEFQQRVCHLFPSLFGKYISPPRGCQALSALKWVGAPLGAMRPKGVSLPGTPTPVQYLTPLGRYPGS